MDESFINCTIVSKDVVNCNGTDYELPEKVLTYEDEWFWIYIGIYTGLVIFAGMMSGLTMGLLSLDSTTLMTMKDGGTPSERKYAARILPVVKRHHLLLVTLLLANSAAVEAMPIFLDRISNPIIAIVISVTAVLIFGEVVPQAICTRFGLAIGANLAPLVYFLMGIFFIISYPLSKILDCCLGTDHGTFFRRAQLKALIDIHGEDVQEGIEGREDTLTHDEVAIIKGALDMKNKTAKDAMVPIEKAYMLSLNDKMDHETMTHMIQRGHSRIPVYGTDRNNIVAILHTKTMIKLDPDDNIPVSKLVGDERYSRAALFVDSDKPLFDLLNLFQTGRSHLAVVKHIKRQPPVAQDIDASESAPLLVNISETDREFPQDDIQEGTNIGMITLEDVIEELLQEEIEDEKDIVQEISQKIHFSLAKRKKSLHAYMHRCRSMPQQHTSQDQKGRHSPAMRQISSSLQEEIDRQMEERMKSNGDDEEDEQEEPGPPRRVESRVRFV